MKNTYIPPDMEIIYFQTEDIITTSDLNLPEVDIENYNE